LADVAGTPDDQGRRTFIDLFCGAGGLSEGFSQVGWRPVLGSDIDPDALATYSLNFPESIAIPGDIRQAAVRRAVLRVGRGVDVVAGGPPCQAFSQVRNHARLLDDPRNSLYREFVAVVRALQPRALVMENVPGLAQLGVLEQVAQDLACGGAYEVTATLVDAADFGVPESRQRLVFIGVHRDLQRTRPVLKGSGATAALRLVRRAGKTVRYGVEAAPGDACQELARRLRDPWDASVVTASQAIGDLARLTPGRHDRPIAVADLYEPSSAFQKAVRGGAPELLANTGVPRMNADTRLRLEKIPPGGNYLDLPEHLMDRYLTGQAWGPHNGSQRLSRRHYYAYRRLHPDIWAWTLNTKADSAYHWSAPRALSVREFARLQSFPDYFAFHTDPRKGAIPGRISGGPGHSCYRQVGNAVPPLFARAIAEAVDQVLDSASQ
jgi:DNA (cytosine-5)-methyltransferase 1